jgi:hypothetical protein
MDQQMAAFLIRASEAVTPQVMDEVWCINDEAIEGEL